MALRRPPRLRSSPRARSARPRSAPGPAAAAAAPSWRRPSGSEPSRRRAAQLAARARLPAAA
eukprot:4541864-Pyramimonas_sp.AAC.1